MEMEGQVNPDKKIWRLYKAHLGLLGFEPCTDGKSKVVRNVGQRKATDINSPMLSAEELLMLRMILANQFGTVCPADPFMKELKIIERMEDYESLEDSPRPLVIRVVTSEEDALIKKIGMPWFEEYQLQEGEDGSMSLLGVLADLVIPVANPESVPVLPST